MKHLGLSVCVLAGLLMAGCATSVQNRGGSTASMPRDGAAISTQKIGRPYQISGRWYTPARQDNYDATGQASWYGEEFHGRPTANGEIFDMNQMTAAHPTLPIPSYIQVTNLDNGRTAVLRLNDRGPFARNRILDVSKRAAQELGFLNRGVANVRVVYLGPKEHELGRPQTYAATTPSAPAPQAALQPELMTPAGPPPATAPSGVIEVAQMTRVEPAAPANTAPATTGAPVQLGPASVSTSTSVSMPAVTLPESGWFVQAGAFSESARAEAVRTQLGGVGQARIETVSVDGRTLHRVLVGPYPAELAASAARYEVTGAGFREAQLVLRN